jgi:hypothetical protein
MENFRRGQDDASPGAVHCCNGLGQVCWATTTSSHQERTASDNSLTFTQTPVPTMLLNQSPTFGFLASFFLKLSRSISV